MRTRARVRDFDVECIDAAGAASKRSGREHIVTLARAIQTGALWHREAQHEHRVRRAFRGRNVDALAMHAHGSMRQCDSKD